MEISEIKKILAECKITFGVSEDEEIHLTSIQLILLITTLEEEFNIEIPDDYLDVEAINSLHKIKSLLISLGCE